MWGDRALGTRERDCMYCELGGDVCGEIGDLGNEKEVVCIVSGEGEYVRRSVRLGQRTCASVFISVGTMTVCREVQ